MAPSPAKLGALFSTTWSFFQSHLRSILIGAAVFGIITGLAQGMFISSVGGTAETMVEDMMGMDLDRIEELSERIAAGDTEAYDELMGMTESLGIKEGMSEAEIQAVMAGKMGGFLKTMLPTFGLAFLILFIIGIFSGTYYTILAIDGKDDPGAIAARVPGVIIPFFLLGIWVILRTFVWIPIIGLIFFIVLAPRFIAASVVLVRDKKGVFESATASYKATSGYWGKIVGNLIVMIIVVAVTSLLVNLAVGMLGVVSAMVAVVAAAFVQQLFTAYSTIFVVQLAMTVLKNPVRS